jgi:hypothetical protein
MEEMEIDLNKIKMEIFEKENPNEARKLKREVEKKVIKMQMEIKDMIEQKIEGYFEKKKLESPCPCYIG